MTDSPYTSHDTDRFLRYHNAVWVPNRVRKMIAAQLPPAGTVLRLGMHYLGESRRRTPDMLTMPAVYTLIEVTEYRKTHELHRVNIRQRWDSGRDLCVVLDLPASLNDIPRPTVVTAYWNRRFDRHENLDREKYEQRPEGKRRPVAPVGV